MKLIKEIKQLTETKSSKDFKVGQEVNFELFFTGADVPKEMNGTILKITPNGWITVKDEDASKKSKKDITYRVRAWNIDPK